MNEGIIVEGQDGLHIITQGISGADFEYQQSFMMLLEHSDDVIDAAMELRSEWFIDSSSPLSMAMDQRVAEIHQLPTLNNPYMAELSETQKQAVIAIFDVTQRILNNRGISHVVVYRGLHWDERPEWMDSAQARDSFKFSSTRRTLSSWSFDRSVAETFASQKNYGIVLKATMPFKNVFAIITILEEAESVCIKLDEDEIYEIISILGGDQHDKSK